MDQTTTPLPSQHTVVARRQAVFGLVINALRKQGCTAATPSGDCVYFAASTGARCGIGHLIAPVYDPMLEGMTWGSIATFQSYTNALQGAAAKRAVDHIDQTYGLDSSGADLDFLSALQGVHDAVDLHLRMKSANPQVLRDYPAALDHYADTMADRFGLTMPPKE